MACVCSKSNFGGVHEASRAVSLSPIGRVQGARHHTSSSVDRYGILATQFGHPALGLQDDKGFVALRAARVAARFAALLLWLQKAAPSLLSLSPPPPSSRFLPHLGRQTSTIRVDYFASNSRSFEPVSRRVPDFPLRPLFVSKAYFGSAIAFPFGLPSCFASYNPKSAFAAYLIHNLGNCGTVDTSTDAPVDHPRQNTDTYDASHEPQLDRVRATTSETKGNWTRAHHRRDIRRAPTRQHRHTAVCVNRTGLSPRRRISAMRDIAFWLLLASAPAAMAQSCISLARSTQCSAFNQSSISTNSNLTSLL